MLRHIPNIITFSRIPALAFVAYWTLVPGDDHAAWAWWMLLWAVASDFLDGYLARRFNWTSNLGKLLDAMIDKVLVLGGFALLIIVGLLVPWWFVTVVVLLMAVREFGITWMRLVAAKKGLVLAAEKTGKIKTAAQMASLLVIFAVPALPLEARTALLYVGWILFYVSAYLTIKSGLIYLKKYGPLLKNGGAA
ncbi:MAG: CDP-diacylglycerol--glycerol-3-phosphate 3-phosphatidyltransferase [Verrucomicrobiota bacterium JB022]|nr:CDP-diacylglycerol--glycerol-3-phosphate 3-phosphatidyltransferase [Verrucomicrobiota bacterium JB022]